MANAATYAAVVSCFGLAGGFVHAQAVDQLEVEPGNNGSQLQLGETDPSGGVQQLSPSGGDADLQIETQPNGDADGELQIQSGSGEQTGVAVDQPKGRDLCDPSVSARKRRAAGVDCDSQIKANGHPATTATAKDPLLAPQEKTVGQEFQDLDLGDDVPSTVILQQ